MWHRRIMCALLAFTACRSSIDPPEGALEAVEETSPIPPAPIPRRFDGGMPSTEERPPADGSPRDAEADSSARTLDAGGAERPDAMARTADAAVASGRFMPLAPNDRPLRFGADQDGRRPFAGEIDRVRIYSRALSAQEIASEAARRYVPCDLNTGCVADWTFDGLQNGLFPSTGAARLPARLVGAVELVDSPEQKAVRLMGGFVQVENNPALSFTDSLTYAAWVRESVVCPPGMPDGCSRQRLVDKGSWFGIEAIDTHDKLLMIFQQPGPFYAQMGALADDGTWTHVAVTFTATSIKFYKNGRLNRTHAPEGLVFGLKPTAKPLRFGAGGDTKPGNFFPGDMDRIRIYGRALSATEIAAHAKRQQPPCTKAEGCVAEWSFEDVRGNVVRNTAGPELVGQLLGSYQIIDGPDGKAVRLDDGAWIEVADDPALALTQAMTFSAWVRRLAQCPPTRSDECYLETLVAKGSSWLVGEVRHDGWRAIVAGKFLLTSSGPRRDVWSHVAITVDAKEGVRLYTGGRLIKGWAPGQPDNFCYNCPGS